MDQQPPKVSFLLAVLASLVAGLLFAAGSWAVSHTVFAIVLAGVAWLVLLSGALVFLDRNYQNTIRQIVREHEEASQSSVTFRRPLTTKEAHQRIKNAEEEIWSFQISGSEFTASSIENYETWLSLDEDRQLLIAFANPENPHLLQNIVKLSGRDRVTSEKDAYASLLAAVKRGRDRYVELAERFPDQVQVRVYNFSPPYSVHAVDPDGRSDAPGSVFVELYLPDLRSSERPSMLLPQTHPLYSVYRDQSLAWFEAGVLAAPVH